MQTSHVHPAAHEIHIVVEVDGKNRPVTLRKAETTGREIRAAAGAPLTDDLTRVIHGKPSGGNIELDEKVKVQNGDHFLAIPTGTVS